MRTFFASIATAAVLFLATLAPAAAQGTADLAVAKSGPSTASAGTDVTYAISVLDVGPDAASGVTLTDPIPAGMTFVSATQTSGPAATCTTPVVGTNGVVSCTIATLNSGASMAFSFTFHIDPATAAGTTFINMASVSSTSFDPNPENDSSIAGTTVPGPGADLGVTKTGPAAAAANSDVTFVLTMTNAGPSSAANAGLTDVLPGTMTFVSLTQTSGPAMTCTTPGVGTGGTVTCSAATFASGTSAGFQLVAHVPPGTPSGTLYTNTATVSSATPDPNPENDSATTSTTVSAVDLSVTKTGPATVVAGGTASYVITVANAGPDAASSVTLVDSLPPGTTFVSLVQNTGPAAICSTPAAGNGGTVSCSYTLFNSGASAQFTLTLNAGGAASIVNTATVSSNSSFDTNPANNSASASTTITPVADVGLTKSGPASIVAGNTATYTLTVTNAGPSAAPSITLTDVLPAGTTFVSLLQTAGPAFTCPSPSATVTCTGALPSGGSATFNLVLRASTPGTISNTATVASSVTDPNAANNSATATTTVTAQPVFAPDATPIPTLSPAALVVLALGMLAAAFAALRRRR